MSRITSKKAMGFAIALAVATLLVLACAAPISAAEDDLDTGTYYSIPWRITSEGTLLIGEKDKDLVMEGEAGKSWMNRSDVRSVKLLGRVKANDFCKFTGLTACESMDLTGLDTSEMINMSEMFCKCSNLTELDVSMLNTSKVEKMRAMFQECTNLKALDLSTFDTHNVKTMYVMFYECHALESLDVSSFNTSNVTLMGAMFYNCHALKSLDVSGFDTSKVSGVRDMKDLFNGCHSLERIDLSNFHTDDVKDMSKMFYYCRSLKNLNLSGLKTNSVTDMNSMFYECNSLTSLNLSEFDTSNVTSMAGMFHNCGSLKGLNLSSFDTRKVTNFSHMFSGCSALKELNLQTMDTSLATTMDKMFSGCNSLTSLNISSFDMVDKNLEGSLSLPAELKYLVLGENTRLSDSDFDSLDYPYIRRIKTMDGVKTQGPEITSFEEYDGSNPGWYGLGPVPIEKKTGPMSLNSRATVLSLAVTNYSYNKKNHKPSIVVRIGNTKLKKGADYTVKYANNRKVGIATVAVIGKGNYDGTIRKTFTITPGKVKVLKKKTYRRKGNLTEIDLRLSQKYGDKADKYMIRIFAGKRIKSTNLVKYKKNFVVQSKLKKNRRYRIEVYAVKGRLKGPVTALTVTGKSS